MNIIIRNKGLRVVFIFLDGVGIGKEDTEINPFCTAYLPALKTICGGDILYKPLKRVSSKYAEVIALNATLGISGLPQSGTSQTAIFTGINGAKKFGRHFGPNPPSILRSIIADKNILTLLKKNGRSPVYVNAFPQRFFDYLDSGSKRLTVTMLSCRYAGVPLLTAEELKKNEAISPDFIRARWPEFGHKDVKPVSPAEAGSHLAGIAENHDFTLFEYWLTDHAGHDQKMKGAVEVLERFDEFLDGFLKRTDLTATLLMIVSDHGNIEDLSVKSHTRNRIPCILAGRYRHEISGHIKNMMHIAPSIIKLFT